MRTLIGKIFSQIAMKGDETMNTCKHERIKSVNCRIFCDLCGAELPLEYLTVKTHSGEQEQPEKAQETAKKPTRKHKA